MKKLLLPLLVILMMTVGCIPSGPVPVSPPVKNRPPTAYIDSISPTEASIGEMVIFAGHGTDPDGTVVAYRWRSSLDGELSSKASFETSSLSVGEHTIYFKVQDNNGTWSEEVRGSVTVSSEAVALPVINAFDASPRRIASGESSTLSWDVSDATTVSIDQGIGNVALTGTRVVSPTTTTTYTLTATNEAGSVTATAQVVITTEPPPGEAGFDPFPYGIDALPMPLPQVTDEEIEQQGSDPEDETPTPRLPIEKIKIPSRLKLGMPKQDGKRTSSSIPYKYVPKDKKIEHHSFTPLSLVDDPWTQWEYSPTVKLFVTFPDDPAEYVGSGSLISPKHVLTAGHVVYNGGWFNSLVAVPAYENLHRPFGSGSGVSAICWSGWTDKGRWAHDMAVVELDRPIGAVIPFEYRQWYFLDHREGCGFYTGGDFFNPGYPAEGPYDGQFMYSWSGNFDGCWLDRNMVRLNRCSYGGQSGSPLSDYVSDAFGWHVEVCAVLSNGYCGEYIKKTRHVVVTSGKYDDIIDFIVGSYPSDVDLIPLGVKTSPEIINPGDQLSSMSFVILNYSQTDWNGPIRVNLYLSDNDFISTEDTRIGSIEVTDEIEAWGNNITVSVPPASLPRISSDVAEGDYWIGVILDITDGNTGNNESHGQDASRIRVGPLQSPNAPSNLVVASTTPDSVLIRWQDNSYTEDGFKIERRTGSGLYSLTNITRPNQTEFRDFEAPGDYCYRVRAFNLAGHSGYSNEVCATVTNIAPTPEIDHPGTGGEFCETQPIVFRGSASDPNEVFTGGLRDNAFTWRSSINGFLGNGRKLEVNWLSPGTHTITLEVCDSGGLCGYDNITLVVKSKTHPDCADVPPTAIILQPEDGSRFWPDGEDEIGKYATVTFVGQATDPEDDDETLRVDWYSDIYGFLGSGRNITARLHAGWHTITLRVTDSAGNTTEDKIKVYVEVLI